MTRIGIILGSTRPNRNGEQVFYIASRRATVDSRPAPTRCRTWTSAAASMGQYKRAHRSGEIASLTGSSSSPRVQHSTSGVLKNAIDYSGTTRQSASSPTAPRRPGRRAPAPGRRRAADGRRAPAGRAVAAHRVRELQRVQARRLQPGRAGHPPGPGHHLERRAGTAAPASSRRGLLAATTTHRSPCNTLPALPQRTQRRADQGLTERHAPRAIGRR